MDNCLEFIVLEDQILSLFLKSKLTKKFYRNLKSMNATILVNDKKLETYKMVYKNDIVKVLYNNKTTILEWELDPTPIDILYEDEHYLVCYKPYNLLTIPTKGEPYSLFQRLLYYFKDSNYQISILNRLDKDTSGLLLVAKDRYSANLMQPVKEHITRRYRALCDGIIPCDFKITAFMEKDDESNKRIISKSGKYSVTNLKVIKRNKATTLCELLLETGRTHQIRLHLSSIGYPIIGDKLYGNGLDNRMYLESIYLSYLCPFSNEVKEFSIDEDFKYEKY